MGTGAGGGGVREVSATVTVAVVPTCRVRAASLNNRICRLSVPSVSRSFARVWEKLNPPVAPTVPLPVSTPPTTSPAVIPVPDSDQYSTVPAATFVVATVVVSATPSLIAADDGVIR